MSNDKKIYVWSSDFEEFTGEGILARSFISNIFKNYKGVIKIKSNNGEYIFFNKKIKTLKYSNYKNNFFNKYIKLFFAIIYLQKYNNKGYKTFYVNYLPLWNFLIFLLLPKKTLIGPITGGKYIHKKNNLNSLIRKYFFPFFFKISTRILVKKYSHISFSTKMLKNYLPKRFLRYSLFEINLICFNLQKKRKKDIDFLFYYRKHVNKSNDFLLKLINKLVSKNKRVYLVGDKLHIKNVINLGNVKRSTLLRYLARTKFSINSGENFYSLFALDCISNYVTIYMDKKKFIEKNYFPKQMVKLVNFNNLDESFDKIIRFKINKFTYSYNIQKLLNKKKYLINILIKKFYAI